MIALVNQTTASWSSGTSISATVPAPTNGNWLVIGMAQPSNGQTITSITQTGATWVQGQQSGTNRQADTWYAANVSGAGTTVTVNLSVAPASMDIYYAEFSGISASATIGAKGANAGSSTTVATASITPTAGREALLFAAARAGGSVSAGPSGGWTGLTAVGTRSRAGYLVVASTSGSYSTDWTAGTGTWDSVIISILNPAGGGGGTNPTASITGPALTNGTYEAGSGRTVVFTGTGTDAEDGTLTGTSLAWSSSLDGALGTGVSLSKSNLSVGTHTITLTVTDSGGLTGTATRTVVIKDSTNGQFYKRTLTRTPIGQSSETAGFQVFIPKNYTGATAQPCIVSLGGTGQRGTDNTQQMTDVLPTRVASQTSTWPTITIFPQWPALGTFGGREWAYPSIAAALAVVEAEWNIDANQRYLFGTSLGAQVALEDLYESYGTWAAVLVSEGCVTTREGLLSGHTPDTAWTIQQAAAEVASLVGALPIRHFQSTADTNNTTTNARITRDAMAAAPTATGYVYSEGAPVAGLDHVSAYTAVVNDDTQWTWLLSKVRGGGGTGGGGGGTGATATVSDDFTGSASNNLGTADTGQTWVNFGGGAVGLDGAGRATTTAATSGAGSVIDSSSPNATVTVDLISSGGEGIVFRYADSLNFWVAQFIGTTLFTRKFVNGVYTDVTNTVTPGGSWSVVCSGDSILVKSGTTTIRNITDSFNASATKWGLLARPGAIYDNFRVYNVASGAAASKLAITQQPVGGQTTTVLPTQPVVQVQDNTSTLVTTDTSTVVATLNTISGSGVLSGTTSKAAANGIVTFTDLAVTGTGTFTITFSDGALTTATTSQFSTVSRNPSPYLNLGSDGKDLGADMSLIDTTVAVSGDRRAVTEPRVGGTNTWWSYLGVQRSQLPRTLINSDMPTWTQLQAMAQHSINSDAGLSALLSSGTIGTGGHVVILDNTVTYTGNYFKAFPLRPGGDAVPGGTNIVIFISKAFWDSMAANAGVCVVAPEKKRVTSSDLANLAYFKGSDGTGSFMVNGPTKGWRFVGLRFGVATSQTQVGHLVGLGNGAVAEQTDISVCPSNLGLDRCWVDGHSNCDVLHAIELNCAYGYVVDCGSGDDIHVFNNSESHVICSYNGPGPFRIVNNRIVGGTQYIFFGGAYSACGMPADIEVRYNYCTCPETWNAFHPSYAGKKWHRKCGVEFKIGKYGLIEYNYVDNVWNEAQQGSGWLLKSEAYGSGPTIGYTSDLLVRYNYTQRIAMGPNIAGVDNAEPAQPPQRVFSFNNIYRLGGTGYENGAAINPMVGLGYLKNSGIIHDTYIADSPVNVAVQFPTGGTAQSCEGLVLLDSIYEASTYGWKVDNAPLDTLNTVAPGNYISSNAVVGAIIPPYPAGTYTPADRNAIVFEDAAGDNFALFGTSQGVVSPAIATSTGFTTQPGSCTSDVLVGTQPVVKVYDQFGAVKTDYTGTVTLTGLGCTVVAGGSVQCVAGVATFTGLVLSAAQTGVFSLSASAPGLSPSTSSSAGITVPAPPPPPPVGSGGQTLPPALAAKYAAKYGKTLVALFQLQ